MPSADEAAMKSSRLAHGKAPMRRARSILDCVLRPCPLTGVKTAPVRREARWLPGQPPGRQPGHRWRALHEDARCLLRRILAVILVLVAALVRVRVVGVFRGVIGAVLILHVVVVVRILRCRLLPSGGSSAHAGSCAWGVAAPRPGAATGHRCPPRYPAPRRACSSAPAPACPGRWRRPRVPSRGSAPPSVRRSWSIACSMQSSVPVCRRILPTSAAQLLS